MIANLQVSDITGRIIFNITSIVQLVLTILIGFLVNTLKTGTKVFQVGLMGEINKELRLFWVGFLIQVTVLMICHGIVTFTNFFTSTAKFQSYKFEIFYIANIIYQPSVLLFLI
ncbi:MAG: hypothetical protein EZS28_024871 [Streblomastix strix]|uniref:Uncharacterized protein n=1 Tax=Streblomastix strix TaxID=222440 RepID=A0A5J4VAT2_9EUKA|nr:MAG: hypothetical protein EZS28_024871 [Streblomastix strix]